MPKRTAALNQGLLTKCLTDTWLNKLANFVQAVRGHPQFNGKSEIMSVDGLEEILRAMFWILCIEDGVKQAQLGQVMLDHKVLQSWSAYCRVENMEATATLTQLISFLKSTYDTVSTVYQALDELVVLKFNADEELPAFNQKFDYLVARANFSADRPGVALNHYCRAMPVDIKKELFAADILNANQAKNRTLVLWRTQQL
ncbi:hypothetical protein H4R20_002691 [Coemansia guatemalensis]|uniref:Uncharacterized protein n=1 Tax=Coemansia guatemalensis TaxID=2761395 RepID=A0A9W8LTC8_9FUNG|nr:hypothetical protein H4R20_002691 [Coemansia guatemalensis]